LKLIEASFYVQAEAARIGARVIGVHSCDLLKDGSGQVSCWFDIDKSNENDGIIICHIDAAELAQLDGPHELLQFVTGCCETKH